MVQCHTLVIRFIIAYCFVVVVVVDFFGIGYYVLDVSCFNGEFPSLSKLPPSGVEV